MKRFMSFFILVGSLSVHANAPERCCKMEAKKAVECLKKDSCECNRAIGTAVEGVIANQEEIIKNEQTIIENQGKMMESQQAMMAKCGCPCTNS